MVYKTSSLILTLHRTLENQQSLMQSSHILGTLSFNGTLTKEDEEMSKSALSTFRAKEEEIEKKKMEVKEKVQAQLGRIEEETKRLATICELLEMTRKATDFACEWIKAEQEAPKGDIIRLADLFKAEGMMPPIRDPEHFSFWLATLANRRPSQRLDLLRLRDTNERLSSALIYIKAEEQGCSQL